MRVLLIALCLVGCSSSPQANPDGGLPDGALPDGANASCGAVTCKRNETCVNGAFCACLPGFVPDASGCSMAPAGSPALHTKKEVCDKWTAGHVVTTPKPFKPGAMACDPGSLDPGGITDTMTRLNMFRWMVGVGDATDDPQLNQADQACAVIQANNSLDHTPPPNAICYNALGAKAAAESNLAKGTGHADSIDLYIEDPGASNALSLGHRRWCLHPPLGLVGVGYFEGAGNKRAQCLGVFDRSGGGPTPLWYAWPPPGYVPVSVTEWPWSFHYTTRNVLGADTEITVKNLTTQVDAPVTIKTLGQNYGDDAISFYPNGWTPTAGAIYRVSVNPKKVAPVAYDVMPVTCP